MNKKYFRSLFHCVRYARRHGYVPSLLYAEKPIIAAVLNNRLPLRDPLEARQMRAVTFAMYGDHAPKPLMNEYTFAGKLHGGDVSKVVS